MGECMGMIVYSASTGIRLGTKGVQYPCFGEKRSYEFVRAGVNLVLEAKLCRIDMIGPWTFDFGIFIGTDFDHWARKELDDGIFFNQSIYIKEMLKKYGLEYSKPIKTPMSSVTKLTRDEDEEFVDDIKYHGMIGSLLYLTASPTDIMFSVCLCAYFQEDPKTSHLGAVKRIFSSCLVNPRPTSPLYQNLSPPIDYQTVPPTNPIVSQPLSPISSLGISSSKLLKTPKTTLPPLTSPPPTPSQPSKQSSLLTINLDLIELIFSTPPTSPHLFLDSLKDLPPRITNPPLLQPSFDIIECLANQPPPLPAMAPYLPPLPPQLLPLGLNNPFPMLTHEMLCDHCQCTQVIVNHLHEEMRFILNHILERLDILAHKNNS
uniref:Retrovirus-related Pol polyprotein from transposon TNT 1-94 n=1 Tax=Tanacetum cinerariifolium TaxID=118510 RepID=A0A6L2JJU0_TANCI|nr:retrovirus-related Pol polyprotein from transposon TNT 1-94 [Tanacetum cinerariifolium]